MPTGNMPLFRCRPSQFWLTRYLRMPRFCNSTRAMWVAVGMACNALADLMSPSLPWARRVHTPSVPRKSAMPCSSCQSVMSRRPGDGCLLLFLSLVFQGKMRNSPAEVDTPAPVKAMKCLLLVIRSTSSWAFRSTTSSASVRSASAILGAELAMVFKFCREKSSW